MIITLLYILKGTIAYFLVIGNIGLTSHIIYVILHVTANTY